MSTFFTKDPLNQNLNKLFHDGGSDQLSTPSDERRERTITIRDGHDRLIDIVDAKALDSLPDVQASHRYAAAVRKIQWDNRRITSHGSYTGGKHYQWLAHVPGRVVELLDAQFPGWDQDETEMRRLLAAYPSCKVAEEVR